MCAFLKLVETRSYHILLIFAGTIGWSGFATTRNMSEQRCASGIWCRRQCDLQHHLQSKLRVLSFFLQFSAAQVKPMVVGVIGSDVYIFRDAQMRKFLYF